MNVLWKCANRKWFITDRCSPSCQPGKLLLISPKLGLLQLPKGIQTSIQAGESAQPICWESLASAPWRVGSPSLDLCGRLPAWFVASESFWPTGSYCVELWCFELFLLDERHKVFPVSASHDQRLFFWLVSAFSSVVLDLLDKNIHKYHQQNLTLGCVVAFMTIFCLGAVICSRGSIYFR